MHVAALVIATGLLLFAAISDIRVRKIPNWTVLALLLPFVLTLATNQVVDIWPALGGGALVLLVTYGLFSLGVFGAGDAKLLSMLALLVGWASLPRLLMATVLVGGAMAVVVLAAQPRRVLVLLQMRGKAVNGRGLPYGVAIAVGGVAVMWGLDRWAQALFLRY